MNRLNNIDNGDEQISQDQAIKEIIAQLKNNSFSVFCGAGATSTEWIKLFNQKTNEYYKFNNDIYMLASIEEKYHNSKNFYNDINTKLEALKNQSRAIIDKVLQLELNQIWTTNFDEIIEKTIKRRYRITPDVINSSQDLLMENFTGKFIVFKLNGTYGKRNKMILTKEDYFNYFKSQRLMFENLKRQLVLDSFLFIGYSFKDDLVLNALREIKEVLPTKSKVHYRFKAIKNYNNAKEKLTNEAYYEYMLYEMKYYYDTYNIKTIIVEDYDNGIPLFLDNLYNEFCKNNVFIAGSFRSINPELRKIIENLVDELVKRLYINKFSVYSGNGRGLGEVVVARTSKHSLKYPLGRFVNRPFIFSGNSNKTKNKANFNIMRDCKTMIIICGQDDSGSSANVKRQFLQFKEEVKDNNALIIPIPQTGFAANNIFNSDTFRSLQCYKNNIDSFYKLENENDPVEIAKIVVNIILAKFNPM